jgi:hypothetical protein
MLHNAQKHWVYMCLVQRKEFELIINTAFRKLEIFPSSSGIEIRLLYRIS